MSDPSDDWFSRAKCRGLDPNIFFPFQGENCADARAICMSCPVIEDCLNYALRVRTERELEGVWGGTSSRERRAIRNCGDPSYAGRMRQLVKAVETTPFGHSVIVYVAGELGVSRRTASRRLDEARRLGLIDGKKTA